MENFRRTNKHENPRVLHLQRGCIYGPVNSRRLGSSLGLNLLPRDYKLCSFNCIYCQYGLNPPQNAELIEEKRDDLPSVSKVRKTLLAALSSLKDKIAYITFSGNGEPTLHPEFPEIVDIVREIRDRYVSRAKLAILSNSTTINNPGIAAALMKLDSPIMKLDAGSEKVFKKINRPAKGFDFNEMVEGLIKFDHPNLIIQALLIGGADLNASDENLERWASLLKKIKPSRVQIYSLDRPPARLDISRLSMSELNSIARKVTDMTGIPVTAF